MAARRITTILLCGVIALAASGCGGGEPVTVQPEGPEARDYGKIAVYGGRDRFLCEWESIPSDVTKVELRFEETGDAFGLQGSSGSKFFPCKEGEHLVDVTYFKGSQRFAEGEKRHLRVYGDKYESELKGLKATVWEARGAWFSGVAAYSSDPSIVGVEYSYTTRLGEKITKAEGSKETVTFEDVDGAVSMRTIYCPSEKTGDRFYSPWTIAATSGEPVAPAEKNAVVDGYRGIWFDLGQATSYGSKYSGGLGTYTMKHIPMAVYSPIVDKTFFVYGGTPDSGKKYLVCMVGCFDHRTGMLQKPRIVYDKGALGVADPHDDPTINIDKYGYIWVFVAGRSNKRNGIRFRSVNPFDISAFEYINEELMAYPQVHYNKDKGFFLFFTRYDGVRQLFYQTSKDGVTWPPHRQLASIKSENETKSGHYQISNIYGDKICTAFNRHKNGDVDTRTNIYFVQSKDWGETWTTVDGTPVPIPITTRENPSLVRDYESEGRNCYIKDVNFDEKGNPVILYLTSDNHKTGPEGGVRQWHTLHWTGTQWVECQFTTSTHCYDSGSLWIDRNGWTIIAPTAAGPQYWGAGGEVEMFKSTNEGQSWNKVQSLTSGSENNQTYMRRPLGASDGFYTFWADGNPDKFSISYLYFATAAGEVFRMPYNMTEEWEKPERR